MRQGQGAVDMEARLIRRATPAALISFLLLGLSAPIPAAAASPSLPTHQQLISAMLTFPQMRDLGLIPLSGKGAVFNGKFDEDERFTTHDGRIESFTFADSRSKGRQDERRVMMVVSFGHPRNADVECRIDEGTPESRVARNACITIRRPGSGSDVVGVSYGIKPAAGVNVIAYVSDEMVSFTPSWRIPSTSRMISTARALAEAQVTRLARQGLLPGK